MPTYATTITDGQRRAVILEDGTAWISRTHDLDSALASGLDKSVWSDATQADPDELRLDAPLRPPVVFCTGQNYRDHLNEKPAPKDKGFEFFLKAGQTISGPAEDLMWDKRVTHKLDYETELGVVIGKTGRHIEPSEAMEHVAGYVVLNDVTARDRQVKLHDDGTASMSLGPGKNFDGATQIGPYMVPRDDVPDPQALRLRTWVDDELRQDNTTANMIFNVAEIVSWMSRLLTLQPGLVIATGTPGGTGWGTDPELGGTRATPTGCAPAKYLDVGQTVRGNIESIGDCTFTVVAS